MSRRDKLVEKLKSRSRNFTYADLRALLAGFGYEESSRGKTSGSRVGFIHPGTGHAILIHKPHGGGGLKRYVVGMVLDELEDRGIL